MPHSLFGRGDAREQLEALVSPDAAHEPVLNGVSDGPVARAFDRGLDVAAFATQRAPDATGRRVFGRNGNAVLGVFVGETLATQRV